LHPQPVGLGLRGAVEGDGDGQAVDRVGEGGRGAVAAVAAAP
jgi:hypothetical protein